MSRLEGGLHSLKANPSAGTDDQNSRHARFNALVGPATHRHVRSGRPHRKMDGRLEHARRSTGGSDTRGVDPDGCSWPKADIGQALPISLLEPVMWQVG